MTDVTLESLAARVAALEEIIGRWTNPVPVDGIIPASRPWQTVVGRMEDTEFTRAWIAEVAAIREADRKAAREGTDE